MAKILYFSVHPSLEYDDILLFQGLGHTVFSLGCHSPVSPQNNPYRPPIIFRGDMATLVEVFRAEGCVTSFADVEASVLTENFVRQFDVVIVMHDIHFIQKHWPVLRGVPVIWRTIGQAIHVLEELARPFRNEGLKIVRWSARERRTSDFIGSDAVIRAYKDPTQFGGWRGRSGDIVTFSNLYGQRYSTELAFFERAVEGFSYKIGGEGNEALQNSIGRVDPEVQHEILATADAYFYIHGSVVPYTLNFIEAWMSGVPVVALRRDAHLPGIDLSYNEVNEFIVHGENGFLVSSVEEARDVLKQLLTKHECGQAIGHAGRTAAIELFGIEAVSRRWGIFLESLDVT